MTQPLTITKAEFARRLGVNPSRVTQLIREGLPVEPDGKVNEAAARAWIDANLDQHRREARKPGSTGAGPAGTATQLRSTHLALKARLLQLELEQRQGALVQRKAVDRFLFERARLERDSWMSWPARIAPGLAAALDADPAALEAALGRLVREHLQELADTPMGDIADG